MLDKDKVMQALRDLGALKCVIDFSGGNDSGDIDSMTFEPPVAKEPRPTYVPHRFNKETGTWEQDALTPEQQVGIDLYDLLTSPIWDRWGSFAGDFYVSGRIEYDVQADTITYKESLEEPTITDSEEVY